MADIMHSNGCHARVHGRSYLVIYYRCRPTFGVPQTNTGWRTRHSNDGSGADICVTCRGVFTGFWRVSRGRGLEEEI
ncbi:unnamed protein product [Nezara viridula]|uniref:Uncharacterized protein n=1 Tax=Nezara viridula TaxID=85310 RepID=A0A9P0HLJ6_NEZVI|nr:unnamed protein product [Nezara viridula]